MKKVYIVLIVCISMIATTPFSYVTAEVRNADYYSIIYREIITTSPDLGAERADWTAKAILYCCQKWGVDPLLMTAIFKQESSFSMQAISPVGAVGIAQLMPGTAASLGVNPYDPLQNVDGGVRYLRLQLDQFARYGEWGTTYAVAAYNAGPGAVQKYGGVPPYEETIDYVVAIGRIYNRLE